MKVKQTIFLLCLLSTLTLSENRTIGQEVLTANELLNLKYAHTDQLSPNGKHLIYSLSTQRKANELPGAAHTKHFVFNIKTQAHAPLFNDTLHARSPQISPDGKTIAFIYKKGEQPAQIWGIPFAGGDLKQLTKSHGSISSFEWNPSSREIAYLSQTQKSDKEIELEKRGYDFIFYEENLKNTNLHIVKLDSELNTISDKQLTKGVNVWNLTYNRQGNQIAYSASNKNLIDHLYMFRNIHIIDVESAKEISVLNIGKKLGNYSFSPDGNHLAYVAALNINDHAVSQVFCASLPKGDTKNLTPKKFKGHINWVNWKNDKEVLCYSDEGVYPKISTISINNGDREIILDSKESGIVFSHPLFSSDFKGFYFTGSTSTDASNIYYWDTKKLKKVTDINPHLKNKNLGKQEVFKFPARDGMQIEGILIKPVNYSPEKKWPLIVYVHGGPESLHKNGWLSGYSTPGQVMAGKGYLVAYINYRASTGYGVDFGMEGFMNPAGKEFDDIADGIEFLTKVKGADKERVGMAGGSYGGYASAWFATYYTKYVKAVCMFVGISNIISKRGTTDIPYEELYVHSGKKLEEQWQMDLERSPIYWAHQSRTATLIYGGADDPRVPPSQSIELYRRMKMNNHPAVRLVQYPGEGHGNQKQVGRIDLINRQIDWLDWYVRDLKPLNGEMPPLDISDKYGLNWKY